MGDENPIRTLRDYSKPSHEGYRNTIELPVGNNVVPLRSDTIRLVQNDVIPMNFRSKYPKTKHLKLAIGLNVFQQDPSPHRRILLPDSFTNSFHREGPLKLHDILDLTLFDNGELVDLRDFAKTSRSAVVPTTLSIEWFDPETSFVNTYTRVPTAEADARLSKFEADFKRQQGEMTNKIDTVLKAITDQIAGTLPSDTVKNLKLSTTSVLSAHSYPTQDLQCSNNVHGSINAITIHPKQPEGPQVNRPDKGPEGECNLGNTNSNPHPGPLASIATEQVRKLNSMLESLDCFPISLQNFYCSNEDDG
ncbi:hypothetical protein Tco_0301088 [Tanacetum coccineum]